MANFAECPICNKKVSNFMYKIRCCLCSKILHKNCTMLNDKDFNELLSNQTNYWSCRICNESLFVFNNVDNDEAFQSCLFELNLDNTRLSKVLDRNFIFDPFDLNDENDDIPLSDLDPDIHFYNDIQHTLYTSSDYFDETSFNKTVTKTFDKDHTFALFHLNIRSLPANLSNMLCYMDNLNIRFDVIGISENWLTAENKELYNIHDYEHISNIRPNRPGGGVSLFVASNIKYTELTHIPQLS